MSDLANLKKRRGICRGLVTKTENQIKTLLDNFDHHSNENVIKLTGLRNQYQNRLSSVKELDESILNSAEPENYENEYINSEEYYNFSYELLANIKFILGLNRAPSNLDPNNSTYNCSIISSSVPSSPRLPKLEITKFDGKILSWQKFWDQYNLAIHSKESLSEIDKFGYLRSLLCDSAKDKISGLSLTSENYKEPIKLLKDRFANPQAQISAHMEHLLKLAPIESVSNVQGLRKLYDKVESSVRNLNSLGIMSDNYGALLVPLLSDKLPPSLRVNIARKFSSEVWNLDQMMDHFKTELVAYERCATVTACRNFEESDFDSSYTCSFANHTNVSNLCAFCNLKPPSHKCRKVIDVSKCKTILRRTGRCFLCLEKGHLMKNCMSNISAINVKENTISQYVKDLEMIKAKNLKLKRNSKLPIRKIKQT